MSSRKRRTNVAGTYCERWGSRGCDPVDLLGGGRMCACGRRWKPEGVPQPVSGAVSPDTGSPPRHRGASKETPPAATGGPRDPKNGTQAARVLALLRDKGTICLYDLLDMRPRVAQYNAVLHHLKHTLGWPVESADCSIHDHDHGAAMHWLAGKETHGN